MPPPNKPWQKAQTSSSARSSAERASDAVAQLSTDNAAHASAVRSYVADLSNRDKLEETIENLLKFAAEPSPIDDVVFTAGDVPPLVPLAEASFDDFEAFLTVRLFGAMALGKYAPKYMAPGKCSSITLTTGLQTKKPLFWMPPAAGGAV